MPKAKKLVSDKLMGTFQPITGTSMPSRITFMGRDITVDQITEKSFTDMGEWNDNTFGIKIKAGMLPSEERDTLLHECIHGLDYLLHLGMTERQVRLLATGLFGMFQENPAFASYITTPLRGTNTQATSI